MAEMRDVSLKKKKTLRDLHNTWGNSMIRKEEQTAITISNVNIIDGVVRPSVKDPGW